MSVDLDALEQLARAATPGPWEAPDHPESVVSVWTNAAEAEIRAADIRAHGEATAAGVFHELGNGIAQDVRGPDAAFIAAANPATVLELVQRLRAAEDHLTAWVAQQSGRARLEQLEAIVRDMAEIDPTAGNDEAWCPMCERWAEHADSCPWRRAVETTK